jgi:S1-C subfamily serine protease
VKEFLSRRDIPFTEKNVAADRLAAQEMIQASGQRGVPVTVIDGQAVVGYDQRRLNALLGQTQAHKPKLGVSIADAASIAQKQSLQAKTGAYVGKVRPGSPAEKAGLRKGDVITELGGRPVRAAADVHAALGRHHPGDRLSLTLDRNGREMRVIVQV